MKWDIDKELELLEASTIAGTLIERVTISGAELLEQRLGKTLRKEDRERGYAHVWSLCLGRENERKLFVYAYKIHTACLKARQIVRRLSPEDLAFYGLAPPRKRKRGSAIRVRHKRATAS